MPSSPLEKIQNIAKDVSQDVKKNKNVWKRWFFVIAGVFSTLIILLIGAIFIYNQVHAQKIYPGVYIGKMNLGGYAPEEAREALHRLTNKINREGILFVADTGDNYKETRITPILIAPEDPDIAREILRFDLEQTLNQAWQLGRQGNFLNKVKYQLLLLIQPQEVALDYSLDNEEFKKILSQNFFELENPGQDARLEIKNHQVSVIPEKYGNSFDYDGALRELERRAAILGFDKPIELKLKIDYPKIKAGDTLLLAAKAEQILEKFKGSSLILKYEDATWEIKQKEIEAWLKFDLKNENDLIININQSSTTAFLENIAKEIDIEVKEPLFTLSTSTDDELKAVEFQAGAGGLKLDMENSCEKIMQEIIKSGELNEVRLVSRVIKPRQTIGDVNDLGIKDLLGVGESNFSGSPTNRRHNIGVGANKLNGLLIAPDEEFSLVQTLGEVNAATGYLPELVIKGNETIPEYGGGLCQIGTTAFRVAIYSGLPITERRPHSYRVSYYEPAGMDATIYNPRPDLKFTNDTGNYILFTTEIDSDILTFHFYGTNDSRKIEVENPPRIWNIKYPGPTKIIETLNLEPGEKKCTERAHNGADTLFTRKITYADDREPLEEEWFSRYVPWQAVCLLGVEELSTATSTEEAAE